MSDNALASDFELERASAYASADTVSRSMPYDDPEVVTSDEIYVGSDFVEHTDESIVDGNKEFPLKPIPSGVSVQEKAEDNESGDVELGGFFSEDAPSSESLPTEIMKLQKKEKMRTLCSDKNIEKLDGIWKKVMCEIQQFLRLVLLVLNVYVLADA